MSTLDFAPALSGFFGSAAGLSASVVTRLIRQWQDEARAFAPNAASTTGTTSTSGLTACTSTSAWRRTSPTAPRAGPAEHWIHLKTTNPIESTFATVRLRRRVTKSPGSRAAGLTMGFKLIESAQDRWRVVNGPHVVALVRAGARFEKGVMVEREQHDQEALA